MDFFATPDEDGTPVYPTDQIDAIGEPYVNDDGNPEVIFQDGVKKIQFTLIGDPPERYESKILNPEDV